MFITMSKEGSTVGGLTDTIATLTSVALQYGVPLQDLVRKFAFQRFEPSGFTKNPQIRQATSVVDYIFRWMGINFVQGYAEGANRNGESGSHAPAPARIERPAPKELVAAGQATEQQNASTRHGKPVLQQDAPFCSECGARMGQAGHCFRCENCGTSSGCSG
jgi:ribonucleoside-diphosphate reductase alpha chain